ncbi:MAG: AAA family ATPase [Anaerolineae bacterium]|nr:UvrD-helicase domain-containing protein [Anaerolineales bacterium]MCQ3978674.1 AAA family ATPase [Anaerolineae bacterium]
MKFVADVHLHSHYSRATSKDLTLEHLSKWAQLKGVHVVGTGDIAHPGWLQEMKQKLEPAEEGLFRLKDEIAKAIQSQVFPACHAPVRFILAGEISSIYKKHEQVRKIHNVIFAPTFEAMEKIQAALERIGNIRSDGRPILGLDSRDLLELILTIDPQNYLIPAHIWTPWFALLGSKSGFDSVEECFDDLTPHIFALETGLSSDPPMNWRVSALDRYTLVSNSDAHSPQKLAREANQFETELSYPAIFEALKTGEPTKFLGTVEFFPEEGKYHYDGHRKCEIRWHPQTTLAQQGLCSVCGKPVTVGVMHRVEMLADRPEGKKPPRPQRFQSLIPLPEVLAEVLGVGAASKQAVQRYHDLLSKLGPELAILQDLPLEEIERAGGPLLAEGVRRMRQGEVSIAGGYDGEYGVIKLFEAQERAAFSAQLHLLGPAVERAKAEPDLAAASPKSMLLKESATAFEWKQADLFSQPKTISEAQPFASPAAPPGETILAGLNPQQREAAECTDAPLIIVAGPGTGKTRTLTYRIAHLILEQGVAAEQILAITFTNKAAAEMASRLTALLGEAVAGQIVIKTFHAFGALMLREAGQRLNLAPNFLIGSEEDRQTMLQQSLPDLSKSEQQQVLEQISAAKNQLLRPESPELPVRYGPELGRIYQAYEMALWKNQVLDFDDLILRAVELLEAFPDVQQSYQARFRWISVDEYQDLNLAQYRLLRLLAGPETNLCVIGDPAQAIYGFRGADRAYFLTFAQDFPGAKTLPLSQNYRSTQLILDASRQVIAKAPERQALELWSDVIDPTRIEVYQAPTEKAEAEYVVHEIEKMVGGLSYFSLDSGRVQSEDSAAGRSFADFAVLYRLGAQSLPLIEAFDRSGIPYQTVGQTPFYEHKEVKELLACLWFIYNPDTAFQLESRWPSKRIKQLKPFLSNLKNSADSLTVAGLIESVRQFVGPQRQWDEKSEARLQQLVRFAIPFTTRLADFLESVALQKETDVYDPRADRVTLMTLHASKGLEFPVVFMAGCEENLLPYQMPGKTFDVEEERRLFYVGMTRAKQRLILTHAKTRFLFGQKYQNQPSPFLNDIENALKEIKKMAARKAAQEKESFQLKLF